MGSGEISDWTCADRHELILGGAAGWVCERGYRGEHVQGHMGLGNEASGGEHSEEGGQASPCPSAVGSGRGQAQAALVSPRQAEESQQGPGQEDQQKAESQKPDHMFQSTR